MHTYLSMQIFHKILQRMAIFCKDLAFETPT